MIYITFQIGNVSSKTDKENFSISLKENVNIPVKICNQCFDLYPSCCILRVGEGVRAFPSEWRVPRIESGERKAIQNRYDNIQYTYVYRVNMHLCN